MRWQILILFALFLPAGPCYSQEKQEPPARFDARVDDEPDHLVPLDPFPALWSTRYREHYRKTLELPKREEVAVMIYLPSFEPEECLVLHESKGERPSFSLIHTRADRNIWYSISENRRDGKQHPVTITRREASLPPELAEQVGRVWDRMVRGTHYPTAEDKEFGLGVMDGETIEFWRHGMYGTTYSPSGGAPGLFVELGRSLIDYCAIPAARRLKAKKDIEQKCQALERYLDKKAAA